MVTSNHSNIFSPSKWFLRPKLPAVFRSSGGSGVIISSSTNPTIKRTNTDQDMSDDKSGGDSGGGEDSISRSNSMDDKDVYFDASSASAAAAASPEDVDAASTESQVSAILALRDLVLKQRTMIGGLRRKETALKERIIRLKATQNREENTTEIRKEIMSWSFTQPSMISAITTSEQEQPVLSDLSGPSALSLSSGAPPEARIERGGKVSFGPTWDRSDREVLADISFDNPIDLTLEEVLQDEPKDHNEEEKEEEEEPQIDCRDIDRAIELQRSIQAIKEEASKVEAVITMQELHDAREELHLTKRLLEDREKEILDLNEKLVSQEEEMSHMELRYELLLGETNKVKDDLTACVHYLASFRVKEEQRERQRERQQQRQQQQQQQQQEQKQKQEATDEYDTQDETPVETETSDAPPPPPPTTPPPPLPPPVYHRNASTRTPKKKTSAVSVNKFKSKGASSPKRKLFGKKFSRARGGANSNNNNAFERKSHVTPRPFVNQTTFPTDEDLTTLDPSPHLEPAPCISYNRNNSKVDNGPPFRRMEDSRGGVSPIKFVRKRMSKSSRTTTTTTASSSRNSKGSSPTSVLEHGGYLVLQEELLVIREEKEQLESRMQCMESRYDEQVRELQSTVATLRRQTLREESKKEHLVNMDEEKINLQFRQLRKQLHEKDKHIAKLRRSNSILEHRVKKFCYV